MSDRYMTASELEIRLDDKSGQLLEVMRRFRGNVLAMQRKHEEEFLKHYRLLMPSFQVYGSMGDLEETEWVIGPGGGWELKPKKPAGPVGCAHVWKDYMGFTEKYKFCDRCGEKDFGESK